MQQKGMAKPFQTLKVRGQELLRSLKSLWQGSWLRWLSLALMIVVTVGGLFYLAADWSRPQQNVGQDFYWSEPSVAEDHVDAPVAVEETKPPQPKVTAAIPKLQPEETIATNNDMQSLPQEADPGPAPEEALVAVMAPSEAFSDLTRPVKAQVTSPFGWRKHPVFGDWRYHPGVDLDAAEGTEVKAVLSGTVAEVKEDDVWGKLVVLDHDGHRRSMYGHLEQIKVEPGQIVEQGQRIERWGKPALPVSPIYI